ncbi:MAG: two-component sensor histidine kinase [Desulfovibrio sp.]|nr:two-component sensor histidine kinase [Desulfovibrio sp.]
MQTDSGGHGRKTAPPSVTGAAQVPVRADKNNKASPPGNEKADSVRSFGVVRSLAWVALTLTLLLSIAVSIYLGNTASKTLIAKNHTFATLLADYLNNQIYRRFTLPTISIFGRIALRNPEQYRQLDLIIKSIIQGLHVENLRIYAKDHTITYSTNDADLGKADDAPPSIDAAVTSEQPIFDLDAAIPYRWAFFRFSLEPNTFRLRTTTPLRMEDLLGFSLSNGEPVMGVLEFSQDVTSDIESAIRFQQLILGVTLLGLGILMGLLLLLVRRAERALAIRMAEEQRLLLELHQHEKLAGMGRVVASIAHEIRNPLGIISSSAELLIKRTVKAEPTISRILQAIYDEAKRLSRTVSDFLDYARPKQLKAERVDAGAIIGQVLAFLSPDFAQRDIDIVRSGEIDSPLWMDGDKDLLYRAFYNIMSNAIQAMNNSGILTIHAECIHVPVPVIHLLFHDTGPGFLEENKHQLLDPFFTTKEGGTGLGLPIVNSIINSHGGTLTLTNAPEGGAQVGITVPQSTD